MLLVFLCALGFYSGFFLLLIINNLQKIIKKVQKKVVLYLKLCNFTSQSKHNQNEKATNYPRKKLR